MTFTEYLLLSPEEKAIRREVIRSSNRIIDNCGSIQDAVDRADWAWIAGYLLGQFGVKTTIEWCRDTVNPISEPGFTSWSDGSWRMWWKVQLIRANRFATPRNPLDHGRLTTELHIGFLHIEETEEMLRLLAENEYDPDAQKRHVQTSSMDRVMTRPEPVNRVALRVVGWKDDE